MLRSSRFARTLLCLIALWVVGVQFVGSRAGSERAVPPSEASKVLGEWEFGESEEIGEWRHELLGVVALAAAAGESDSVVRPAGGGVLFDGGEWPALWSRPPPRV
jgi:hypothetical protein